MNARLSTPTPLLATAGLIAAASAFAALLLSMFWIGFIASDDIFYIRGAYGWIEQFPYVGKSHWELRHTLTLPLAAFIKAFGLHGMGGDAAVVDRVLRVPRLQHLFRGALPSASAWLQWPRCCC